PSRTRSAARPRAAPPELQARTTVSRGPVAPYRRARTSACDHGMTCRRRRRSTGSSSPSRARRQCHASASSMPPPMPPITTPARTSARFTPGGPDEAHEAPQRGEVLDDVLALLDHHAEALLERDRQLDEVQGIHPQRPLDALGERRVQGDSREPLRLELEPLHDDVLELSSDRALVHFTSLRSGARGAPRSRSSTSR